MLTYYVIALYMVCVIIHNKLKQEYFSQALTTAGFHNPTHGKNANQLEAIEMPKKCFETQPLTSRIHLWFH